MTTKPLIEPAYCPDIFATGLASVERLPGGNIRFVLCVEMIEDGHQVQAVVCRLVRPIGTLPETLRRMVELLDADSVEPNGALLVRH